ncbi:hypothetical protein TNCV_2705821 [Trichonephila clavipes]|nr:hypothetical protein TNCV_2705821 [Trichonephila clavipes]
MPFVPPGAHSFLGASTGFTLPRCPSDLSLLPRFTVFGKHGLHEPGNPSDPSLFSALFLAIPISLSFFFHLRAHFRLSTGGHVPEVPE